MAGSRRALIVATEQYEDPELRKLRAPAKDAQSLAEVLGDPALGDFEVSTLLNETHWRISEGVEELLSEARVDDFLVLHFSCHGIKDSSGELYLAASNTRPNLLASTAVEAALVNRLIRRSRAQRVVLLLDCCFGGAFERGMSARATGAVDVADQFQQRDQDLGGGRGRVVITSSSAMEFAFEGTDLADGPAERPSVFTGALVEGLTSGAADRDRDGKFSLGEVYDYVFDRVREIAPNQTPNKFEYGVQGDFVLARNPKWVVTPGQLPPQLATLAEDPYAPTRLGSVADLKRLASGSDLPLAAAAKQQLDLMVDDDSRQVAAAAAGAVADVELRVSATNVDLGEVHIGDRSPVAEITIEGPPLALSSRVDASTPSVLVRRLDRTIRIEVDTSAIARIDGSVTISGTAGTVIVPITAAVNDRPASTSATELPATVATADPHPVAEQTLVGPNSSDATTTPPPQTRISDPVRSDGEGSESGDGAVIADPTPRLGSRPSNRSRIAGDRRSVALVGGAVGVLVLAALGFSALRGGGGSATPSGAIEVDAAGDGVQVYEASPPFDTILTSGKSTILTFTLKYVLKSQPEAYLSVSLSQSASPATDCSYQGNWVDEDHVEIQKGSGQVRLPVAWHGGLDNGKTPPSGMLAPVPALLHADSLIRFATFRAPPDACYQFLPAGS